MAAVAAWERAPSADELLDRRLAVGWRPRPTATRAGDVVLGHAACRFAPVPGQGTAPAVAAAGVGRAAPAWKDGTGCSGHENPPP